MSRFVTLLAVVSALAPCCEQASGQKQTERILRNQSELLRHSPKRFATLLRVDEHRHEVEVVFEGEKQARVVALD